MTKESFKKLIEQMQDGDFVFVEIIEEHAGLGDIPGMLVEYGTGRYNHIEPVYNIKDGMVLCADGKSLEWYKLDRYLQKKKAVNITVMRLKGIDKIGIQDMKNKMDELHGKPYDWGNVADNGMRGLLCKIPILGFFIGKFIWKIPPVGGSNNNDAYACHEVGKMCIKAVKKPNGSQKYNVPNKLYNPTSLSKIRCLEYVGETYNA